MKVTLLKGNAKINLQEKAHKYFVQKLLLSFQGKFHWIWGDCKFKTSNKLKNFMESKEIMPNDVKTYL